MYVYTEWWFMCDIAIPPQCVLTLQEQQAKTPSLVKQGVGAATIYWWVFVQQCAAHDLSFNHNNSLKKVVICFTDDGMETQGHIANK